jgi:hypothetical protein
MGYAPRAFVGVNSTQEAEAPRLLIVPAETLNRTCPILQSTLALDSVSDLILNIGAHTHVNQNTTFSC